MPEALLMGFGYSGATLHAPLLRSTEGWCLAGVVSRNVARVWAAGLRVPVWPTLREALTSSTAEVVIVATPNETHAALVLQALRAGRHVVVEKPLALDMAQTHTLLDAARCQRRVLTVFQNRRWDADWLALQRVLHAGSVGRVVRVESRMERYRPQVRARWREGSGPGAGLWFDLAPHLLDQVLLHWGWPHRWHFQRACLRPAAVADDWFHATLHYSGLVISLQACMVSPHPGPRWIVHGSSGSYIGAAWDPQEQQLRVGQASGGPHWGYLAAPGLLWRVAGEDHANPTPHPLDGTAGDYRIFYAY
jgi:predicted dehydrogenase